MRKVRLTLTSLALIIGDFHQQSFLKERIVFLPSPWSSGEVAALRLVGCGFYPQPSHVTMVPRCLRGCWVKCGEQILHSLEWDDHWDFSFIYLFYVRFYYFKIVTSCRLEFDKWSGQKAPLLSCPRTRFPVL